jgi:UDP-N-acetylmuramate--alanine ligase
MKNTMKKILINADDKNLRGLTAGNPVTFSIRNPSHYMADEVVYRPFSTDFAVHGTKFSLSLPGKFNLYNALSCIAFLSEIGVSMKAIAEVMPEFQGIDRRFDIHLNERNRLVIDDYAHNPHKIASLMETVKHLREDVCYIFQPHGFGPTRLMKKEYIETFSENLRDSDHLILLPIYYVGGTAGKDISSHDLASGISAVGKSVEVIEDRKDILRNIHKYRNFVIFGARDETLSDFAKEIANTVRVQ